MSFACSPNFRPCLFPSGWCAIVSFGRVAVFGWSTTGWQTRWPSRDKWPARRRPPLILLVPSSGTRRDGVGSERGAGAGIGRRCDAQLECGGHGFVLIDRDRDVYRVVKVAQTKAAFRTCVKLGTTELGVLSAGKGVCYVVCFHPYGGLEGGNEVSGFVFHLDPVVSNAIRLALEKAIATACDGRCGEEDEDEPRRWVSRYCFGVHGIS